MEKLVTDPVCGMTFSPGAKMQQRVLAANDCPIRMARTGCDHFALEAIKARSDLRNDAMDRWASASARTIRSPF